MRLSTSLFAISALAALALVGSVHAGSGGRAEAGVCRGLTFHDERAEGGVCCFADHYHSGVSSGQPSRAAAVRNAVKAWEDFIWFEYGSKLDSWGNAHSKSVSCSSSSGWSCTVEARACYR